MDVELVRASGLVRAAGLGAMAIGVALVSLTAYGAWLFALPGLAALAYGARRWRIAAVADSDGVIVRNQFRTFRVPWVAIAELGFYERDVSSMQWSMRSRSCGLIYTVDGRRLWVEATEATNVVLSGMHITEPGQHGPSQLERLHRRWRQAIDAAPSP